MSFLSSERSLDATVCGQAFGSPVHSRSTHDCVIPMNKLRPYAATASASSDCFALLIDEESTPMDRSQINPKTSAMTTFAMIHPFAVLDAALAPSMSPMASFVLTIEAYTIETMPPMRQQNTVDRIAPTMWLGTEAELADVFVFSFESTDDRRPS